MKLRRIGQSWGLGRFILLIGFTVVMTGLGIWQVKRQYQVVEQGYAIDRNLFEYRRLLERQKRLNLLLSAYKDPSALQVFAEEELGMRRAGREDVLYIPDPRETTQLTTTRPAMSGTLPDAPTKPGAPGANPTPDRAPMAPEGVEDDADLTDGEAP
jgi:hypothetical protein